MPLKPFTTCLETWEFNRCAGRCLLSETAFNHLIPESDMHLISPNSITVDSHIRVMRIKEMLAIKWSSWLLHLMLQFHRRAVEESGIYYFILMSGFSGVNITSQPTEWWNNKWCNGVIFCQSSLGRNWDSHRMAWFHEWSSTSRSKGCKWSLGRLSLCTTQTFWVTKLGVVGKTYMYINTGNVHIE